MASNASEWKNQFSQDAMDAITDKVLAFKPKKKANPPTAEQPNDRQAKA